MTVLQRLPVIKTTAAWLAAGTGRPFGAYQAPADRPFPYGIVYAVPGGGFSGPPLTGPNEDVDVVLQVNAAGLRDTDADALQDAVRALMLAREGGKFVHPFPHLDGWSILDRRPDGAPGGVDYSGAPPRRVFTATERYVLSLTPHRKD